ncbi:unnamed protein product [Didymodactylos carnosus]|uniref:Uncharacterized protein n=1 Tax=Didymodactylos carnosus TaxID=1234261 RepID=A0A815VQB1_9BILA|nr:unnamed protein product [Didymodactylos carnosus]CAF1553008.1 unnamed protein product [Didymodactylos carnosus]CAF4343570.1 unnamed protein product [Didymodactylos carnosus]CAF4394887.1 unnamed protein product [Didymodactylos carnosus]
MSTLLKQNHAYKLNDLSTEPDSDENGKATSEEDDNNNNDQDNSFDSEILDDDHDDENNTITKEKNILY